MYEIF